VPLLLRQVGVLAIVDLGVILLLLRGEQAALLMYFRRRICVCGQLDLLY
jgi:hypothetical protein